MQTNPIVTNLILTPPIETGVLKTEEAADRFFRIATELCVEACLNSAQPGNNMPCQHSLSTHSTSTSLT